MNRQLKTLISALPLLIGACSVNTSDGDSRTLMAEGRVVDAVTLAEIPDVRVSIEGLSDAVLTGSDGRFELNMKQLSDEVSLQFEHDGYYNEIYANFPSNETVHETGPVKLVPIEHIGSGGASGAISDLQGYPVAGAVVRFVRGINVLEEIADLATTTDAQGRWELTGLDAGNYTCVINVDGQAPVYETVQVLGGIESDWGILAVATSNLSSVEPAIQYPSDSTFDGYTAADVTWSYRSYDYHAMSGTYSVDQLNRTGSLTLLQYDDGTEPLHWSSSSVFIVHTFSGPGIYPIVDTKDDVKEAARNGYPAAFVLVGASGPKGTHHITRWQDYVSIYSSPIGSESPGSVSVTTDNEGRYRFGINSLELVLGPYNSADSLQPDAPASIVLDLRNGYVP